MFANAYQSGSHLEVFDSKINKQKNQFYAKLFKTNAPNGVKKEFDKQIKGFLLELEGHNTKLIFPKDDKQQLCLVQQYLVLQIFIPVGFPWSVEITVSDTTKTKRRINLTSAITKPEIKYFHVKYPIDNIKKNIWLNLSIDVYSFMAAWKGSTFRSIDQIVIGAYCKLRRIFTMRQKLIQYANDDQSFEYSQHTQGVFVPKNYQLNNEVIQVCQVLEYQNIEQNQSFSKDIKNDLINNATSSLKTVKKVIATKTTQSKFQQKKTMSNVSHPIVNNKKLDIPPKKVIEISKSKINQQRHIIQQIKQNQEQQQEKPSNLKKNLERYEKKQKFEPMGKAKKVFLSDVQDVNEEKKRKINEKKITKSPLKYQKPQEVNSSEISRAQMMKIKAYHQTNSQQANEHLLKNQSKKHNQKIEQLQQEEYYCGDFEDSLDGAEEQGVKVPLNEIKKNTKQLQNLFPSSIITKKNKQTVVVQIKPQHDVQLIYDDVLECYYDPTSNTYYELEP